MKWFSRVSGCVARGRVARMMSVGLAERIKRLRRFGVPTFVLSVAKAAEFEKPDARRWRDLRPGSGSRVACEVRRAIGGVPGDSNMKVTTSPASSAFMVMISSLSAHFSILDCGVKTKDAERSGQRVVFGDGRRTTAPKARYREAPGSVKRRASRDSSSALVGEVSHGSVPETRGRDRHPRSFPEGCLRREVSSIGVPTFKQRFFQARSRNARCRRRGKGDRQRTRNPPK